MTQTFGFLLLFLAIPVTIILLIRFCKRPLARFHRAGRESGWVANVLAASTCEIETRGTSHPLFRPVLVHDPSRRRFPLRVRFVLRLIDANDYLELEFHLKA
jgi:hypothetical protein